MELKQNRTSLLWREKIVAQTCSKSASKRRYLLQEDQEVNRLYLAGPFMSSVLQPYKLSNKVGRLLSLHPHHTLYP